MNHFNVTCFTTVLLLRQIIDHPKYPVTRNFKLVAFFFIKLRIMHAVNWLFIKLQVFTG